MKFQVTRQQIIKALKTEPLRAGAWAHLEETDKTKFKNNNNCPVCAVGAIINSTAGATCGANKVGNIANKVVESAVHDDFYSGMTTKELIEVAKKTVGEGKPLTALSSLFEKLSDSDYGNYSDERNYTTADGFANYRLRRILVNFVKSTFPTKIVIDTKIGGNL